MRRHGVLPATLSTWRVRISPIERGRLRLHRYSPSQDLAAHATIRIADLEIDPAMRVVRRDGQPVQLSPRAFDLLLAPVRRRGAVASRLELMQEVWGDRAAGLSRTVDAHLAELRRKLLRGSTRLRVILTVWMRGHRIDP
jgi:two-component system, OmpR family, alkaline phosphatase synthesis response regulator PhoP